MKKQKKKGTAVVAVAEHAMQVLAQLEQKLPLDDDMLVHDRKVAGIRMRVPTTAIQVAVAVLEQIGNKAGGFDLEGTRDALLFEIELTSVAEKLRTLADRIETTINKRRSKAVATTTGLFRSLEGLARSDGTVIPFVERLAPHVRTGRRARSTTKPDAQAPVASAPSAQPAAVGNDPPVVVTPHA